MHELVWIGSSWVGSRFFLAQWVGSGRVRSCGSDWTIVAACCANSWVSVSLTQRVYGDRAVSHMSDCVTNAHMQSCTQRMSRGGVCIIINWIPSKSRISTFSVNLTFDKTLVVQFCYFFLQKWPLFGLQMCKCSKLNLNTFALNCCTSTVVRWIALHHHSGGHADKVVCVV